MFRFNVLNTDLLILVSSSSVYLKAIFYKLYTLRYNITLNFRNTPMSPLSKIISNVDQWAISTSAICAVHCLCLPLLLGVFPALSTSIFGQEGFHKLLIWLIIPLSLFSLTLGCKRHRKPFVALLGLMGVMILFLTAFLGHVLLGEFYERLATLVGASAIAAAHVRNFILCRQEECSH